METKHYMGLSSSLSLAWSLGASKTAGLLDGEQTSAWGHQGTRLGVAGGLCTTARDSKFVTRPHEARHSDTVGFLTNAERFLSCSECFCKGSDAGRTPKAILCMVSHECRQGILVAAILLAAAPLGAHVVLRVHSDAEESWLTLVGFCTPLVAGHCQGGLSVGLSHDSYAGVLIWGTSLQFSSATGTVTDTHLTVQWVPQTQEGAEQSGGQQESLRFHGRLHDGWMSDPAGPDPQLF